MKIYLDNCCLNRPFDDQPQIQIEFETKEKFDYTKWQKEFFENIPDDVLMREAVNYDRTRHYNNNKGSGNYTEERDKLLAGITLEDVMRDFEQNLNLQDNIKHEDKRD